MDASENHPLRYLPLPRASAHRSPPLLLPSDPVESAALVVRLIQTGETGFDRSGAIEAANLRVERLRDADPETALKELAGHTAILDALFQHFAVRAVTTTNHEAASKFGKLSLASQNAFTRALIACEGLMQQRRGKALVSIEGDSDENVCI